MNQNPYESPQSEQQPKASPDGDLNAWKKANLIALGCLMFPASFIAFFGVCTATWAGDEGLVQAFSAAVLVACLFICAMAVVWSWK